MKQNWRTSQQQRDIDDPFEEETEAVEDDDEEQADCRPEQGVNSNTQVGRNNRNVRQGEAQELTEGRKKVEEEETGPELDHEDEEVEEPDSNVQVGKTNTVKQGRIQDLEEEQEKTEDDEEGAEKGAEEADEDKPGEEEKEEEAEHFKVGTSDYLGNWEEGDEEEIRALCLACIMHPCICMLTKIEQQINNINSQIQVEEPLVKEDEKEGKIRKRKRSLDKDEDQGEYKGHTPRKQCKASGKKMPLTLQLVGGGSTWGTLRYG